MSNFRTPEQTVADCQQRADRCDRQGQPKTADDYRAAAAESELMAVRIAAVLSVEREGR